MIKLSSLLREAIEFTPRGNLWIDNPDSIPPDKWERINRIMNNKGYMMRGGDDCKRAVTKFLDHASEPQTISAEYLGAWVDTIAMVMGVKPPRPADGPKYDCKKVLLSAMRTYGTTNNIMEAGYILPSGKLLRLTGNPGTRDMDHREINSVYSKLGIEIPPDKNQSNSNVMMAFMKDCRAIRCGGSQPNIDMYAEPTRQQGKRIVEHMKAHNNECILVCRSEKFGWGEHNYKAGTNPVIVLRDIVNFYKTGDFLTPDS